MSRVARFRRFAPSARVRRALTATVGTSLLFQATLLITGIVTARALGPEDRGYFALLSLVAGAAWQIAPLGIPYAVTNAIARAPETAVAAMRTAWQALRARIAAGVAISALALAALTAAKPDYVRVGAALTLLTVPGVVVQSFGLAGLQGLRVFTAFNRLRLAPNALYAVLVLALWVAGIRTFLAYVVVWMFSRVAFAPFAERAAWRHAGRVGGQKSASGPTKAWLVRFGWRSMFSGASPLEVYRLDQAVVALFLTSTDLGLYVAALAFANPPRFIAQSVGLVATPSVAASPDQRRARRKMWRFFVGAIPLYAPVFVVLWLLAPELVNLLFGHAFDEAVPITRVLLIASAISCARQVLSDAARGAGYPGLGSVAEIVATVAAFPPMAVFVPLWGAEGVGVSLIIAASVSLAVLAIGLLRPPSEKSAQWFDAASGGGVE